MSEATLVAEANWARMAADAVARLGAARDTVGLSELVAVMGVREAKAVVMALVLNRQGGACECHTCVLH